MTLSDLHHRFNTAQVWGHSELEAFEAICRACTKFLKDFESR